MTRRYGDAIEVRRRDDVPAEFLWKGRLHVVREVLAHWFEAGAWWQGGAAASLLGGDQRAAAGASTGAAGGAGSGAGAGAGDEGLPGGSLAVDDAERELWRVEASTGRSAGTGVHDLALDWSTGSWTLTRTLD